MNCRPPEPDGLLPINNQARKTLTKALSGTKVFDYLYDFGDDWEHRITVETTIPAPPRKRVPYCIEGANACPSEDVGGPHGYEDFRAAMTDYNHPRFHEAQDWYGPWLFNPERFNLRETNEYLRDLLP
ncbi:MAG: plasmid pRiA4b ORF-3 family protein [Pseudomonas sp.]|nr:plasmid pRiA4b ORF-3 family protein [Pseudomonas sp.]